LVGFSDPLLSGVSEVVVTAPGSEPVGSVEELAGREIVVRRSSSYYESLQRLNLRFAAEGWPLVELTLAEEHLEDEELLEMVNAGLIPAVVVDSHKAQFWQQIFEGIDVHPDVAVASDGKIAWAFRKGSPKLRDQINAFVRVNRKGTLMGNVLFKKYLRNTRWIGKSLTPVSRQLSLNQIEG
jgi:membrane-bound lytic murein transglycosylase MltF